ncbi:MAG: hypothetical protein JWP20_1245 [Roseomonas sp.]|jgi:HAMP domain-containing protein|nr:hypothetical protein [Roseomonas sp.]
MSTHWWYVTAAWALAGLGFGAMLLATLRRHAAARRRLAALDTRGAAGRPAGRAMDNGPQDGAGSTA